MKKDTKPTKQTHPSKLKGLVQLNNTKPIKENPFKHTIKYLYPENCITTDQRKTFRRKARATEKVFNRAIYKLTGTNKKHEREALKQIKERKKAWITNTLTRVTSK